MKAKKESISLPENQAEWIITEMARTRRKRSSIIQEAVEMLMEARRKESAQPKNKK